MADINHVITLGIGTPGAILEFLTVGLQIAAAPTVQGPDVFPRDTDIARQGLSQLTVSRQGVQDVSISRRGLSDVSIKPRT